MSGDREPRTIGEVLDAARDGREFGDALTGLFAALDRARYCRCGHADHLHDDRAGCVTADGQEWCDCKGFRR